MDKDESRVRTSLASFDSHRGRPSPYLSGRRLRRKKGSQWEHKGKEWKNLSLDEKRKKFALEADRILKGNKNLFPDSSRGRPIPADTNKYVYPK